MKTNIFVLLCVAFVNVAIHAQEQKMAEGEIAIFRQSVNAASKKIKSMSTEFTQYKHMDFLSKDIETSGKMLFKAPNLLQWQYKKPFKYSIIFKNGKILIDDEGKKSSVDVGNSKIFAKINKLIVGSVSGDMFDDKEFSITYFRTSAHNITKLIPKDAALKKYIRQIELTFDKQDATVVQVRLIESSEDFTKIVFNNKILNAKIDDSVFNN